MPAISELPDTLSAFTGAELIALVQDGETRQAPLHAALDAITPSLSNARWVKTSASGFINDTDHTFAYDPYNTVTFSALAKVDARRTPQDLLLWEHRFTPQMTAAAEEGGYNNDFNFDGSSNEAVLGLQFLDGARFTLTATSGDLSATNTIEVWETNNESLPIRLLHTFTAVDQPLELTVEPDRPIHINLIQSGPLFAASVNLTRTHDYATHGEAPQITANGDLLNVAYGNAPRPGQLAVKATLHAGDGTLLAESAPLTLNLSETTQGGFT